MPNRYTPGMPQAQAAADLLDAREVIRHGDILDAAGGLPGRAGSTGCPSWLAPVSCRWPRWTRSCRVVARRTANGRDDKGRFSAWQEAY